MSHNEKAIKATANRLPENPDKIKKRGSLVEHSFGTLKDRLGRDHFVCRGLALVGAELFLSALACNLTRVIKHPGVPFLLSAIVSLPMAAEENAGHPEGLAS